LWLLIKHVYQVVSKNSDLRIVHIHSHRIMYIQGITPQAVAITTASTFL